MFLNTVVFLLGRENFLWREKDTRFLLNHEKGQNHLLFSDKHKLIAILLNHGANPNRTTTAGLLPIDYAIKHNDIQTVRMLLEAGSDEGFEARLM